MIFKKTALALLGLWMSFTVALRAAEEIPLEERIQKIQQEVELKLPGHGTREAVIAKLTVMLMARFHVLQPQLTGELSSRWFQNYFEMLDPSKMYFLRSDIEEFRSQEGQMWDSQLNVNVDFAFAVYGRMLERVRAWVLYSIVKLDSKPDFTVDESMPLNVKPQDIEWCGSQEELHARWDQWVKNVLLAEELKREEQDREKKDSENAAPAEASAESSAGAARKYDARLRNKKLLVSSYQYRREADADAILGYYLNALGGQLDPHTNYLPPETKDDFDIHMRNSLQGAGFVLSQRDFYVTVMSLLPGGPAARDGHLKPGDRILAVAQTEDEEPTDVMDMPLSKVVKLIRGPKGTPVYLTVQPDGSSTEYVLKLVRDEVVLKESSVQSIIHEVPAGEGKTARIVQLYVPSFYCDLEGREKSPKDYRGTTMDTRRLLNEALQAGPVDGVILDLRGNGGGYLDEACGLCGLFLKGGPVVQTRMGDEMEVLLDSDGKDSLYDGPLVVLVDQLSASASEIAAACLQDRGRAVVCGDVSTHGKGSVQIPLELKDIGMFRRSRGLFGVNPDGSSRDPGGVKITNGRFYRINGVSTQAIGVVPDIVFPSFIEYMDTREISLPHVLPPDRIKPVKYERDARVDEVLPALKACAAKYMKENADAARYVADVERYRRLREQKTLPLEINARRKFQEEERECQKRVMHYYVERGKDETEGEVLKDGDEEEWDDKEPKVDVVLGATLEIMKEMSLCLHR